LPVARVTHLPGAGLLRSRAKAVEHRALHFLVLVLKPDLKE